MAAILAISKTSTILVMMVLVLTSDASRTDPARIDPSYTTAAFATYHAGQADPASRIAMCRCCEAGTCKCWPGCKKPPTPEEMQHDTINSMFNTTSADAVRTNLALIDPSYTTASSAARTYPADPARLIAMCRCCRRGTCKCWPVCKKPPTPEEMQQDTTSSTFNTTPACAARTDPARIDPSYTTTAFAARTYPDQAGLAARIAMCRCCEARTCKCWPGCKKPPTPEEMQNDTISSMFNTTPAAAAVGAAT